MDEQALREQMCDVGHRMWLQGLVGGAAGNISCRLSPEWILCTPSGVGKGHLHPDQLVIIDTVGNSVSGEPSSEIKMHLRMYARRPDCVAVVHAHPPVATALALAGKSIPEDVLPEAMVTLGPVATIPFCMPGTDEVPDALDPLLGDYKTFLLSNHGAVVMGADLMNAYYRMEALERVAQMLFYADAFGGAKAIPPDAFEKLKWHLNGAL